MVQIILNCIKFKLFVTLRCHMRSSFTMSLLYHAYTCLGFLILACTIYILASKPLPLTSKVAVEHEDYQMLVAAVQKYVVQEKQEGKLKKLLREAKKTIADLKAKIESLVAELAATKDELAQYKSVCGQLHTADLKKENDRLRRRVSAYEDVISRNNFGDVSLKIRKRPSKKKPEK